MASERYLDLLKQGFMKPRRERVVKVPRPSVACNGCMNWHAPGKHTIKDRETRKRNAAGFKTMADSMEKQIKKQQAKPRTCDFSAILRERGLSRSARQYRVVGIKTARWVLKRRKEFETDDVPSAHGAPPSRTYVVEMLSSWESGPSPSHSQLADQILAACPQLRQKTILHWKGF